MGITKGEPTPGEIALVEGLGPDESIRREYPGASDIVLGKEHTSLIRLLDDTFPPKGYYNDLHLIKRLSNDGEFERSLDIPLGGKFNQYPYIFSLPKELNNNFKKPKVRQPY